MVSSPAKTVEEYIASLPLERREAITAVRDVILAHLPEGYEETMEFGMISYGIPLSRYPNTYNGKALPLVSLASQKNHMALYLMCVYADKKLEQWFLREYKKSGKKLDMGKSCLRFKQLQDIPLAVIGELIGRMPVEKYLALYGKAKKRG